MSLYALRLAGLNGDVFSAYGADVAAGASNGGFSFKGSMDWTKPSNRPCNTVAFGSIQINPIEISMEPAPVPQPVLLQGGLGLGLTVMVERVA